MKQKNKYILLNQEEFSNWLFSSTFKRTIKLIQNHHTFIPNYSHFNGKNYFEKVEGMERTHIEKGFGEIAQNITTFSDGFICVCRDFNKEPCGIRGANVYGICIEHLGNFDLGGDKMTNEHKSTILFLNALLCVKFNLKPDVNSIIYHHWYDLNTGKRTDGKGVTKSCPGTNFFGGNTIEVAKQNFIPLVISVYESLLNSTQNKILQTGRIKVALNDVLNVRKGPGKEYNFVKSLNNGDLIQIFEEKDGWYKIDVNDNQWVNGKFIEKI